MHASVLIVDDDFIDSRTLERALKKANINCCVASDGKEALEILRGKHHDKLIREPCIVMLDIGMPRMGGIEMLRELREDPELKDTIVFMFTASVSSNDIKSAYAEGISGFISKHNMDSRFEKVLEFLSMYDETIEFPE